MTDTSVPDNKFANTVQEKGYASKEQIERAFQEQQRQALQGNIVSVGNLLVQAEIITLEQHDEILEFHTEKDERPSDGETDAGTVPAPEEDRDWNDTDPPPDLTGAKKVQNDSGFELAILPDKSRAYIYPQGNEPLDVGLEVIKGLVQIEGIKFGIAADRKIAEYLASRPARGDLFKIAQGKSFVPGKPTKIKYHFDTNPLKPATIDESGKIDYKNRGKIPMVKEGDLLAEIIPGTEGQPGRDIYGGIVDPPPPDLVHLSCGMGVKKSKDGLKAYSEIYGRPELLDNGSVCVSDTLSISGDVGIETGHIEFDGKIDIRGAIQEGYRVKGKTLTADEIHKAQVDIEGDILIRKGIIGANVVADGKVKARHIRDATIDALDDIIVEREIYESHLETNGVLRIERGTILGSTISAMKGIEASEIGSEASDPCTLITGIDNRLEKQITSLNMQIAEKEKQREKLKTLLHEVRDRVRSLKNDIQVCVEEKNQTISKGNQLKQTLESLKETDDRPNIIKALNIIKILNCKLKQTQNKIDKLEKNRKQSETDIDHRDNEIQKLEEDIRDLQSTIKSLLENTKVKQPAAGVRATGNVYDRTSIRGRNASLIIKGILKHVYIQEIKNPDPDSGPNWIMNVSRI